MEMTTGMVERIGTTCDHKDWEKHMPMCTLLTGTTCVFYFSSPRTQMGCGVLKLLLQPYLSSAYFYDKSMTLSSGLL